MTDDFDKYRNTKPYPGSRHRNDLLAPHIKRIDETPLTAADRVKEMKRATDLVDAELSQLRKAYQDEEQRIADLFWADFDDENGIRDLPDDLRKKIHGYAWDRGHSSGYHEVMNYGYDIAEMVLAAYAAGKKAVAQ